MTMDYIYGEKKREFLQLEKDNRSLKRERDKYKITLQQISRIACGEDQVADDDSEGMKVIFDITLEALPAD